MSLPRDLPEQARHLSRREPRRPRQASLRRAVFAAYYAVFHLLVDDGARMLASGTSVASLQGMFSRSLTHDEIKSVCNEVAKGQWPLKVRAHTGTTPVPQELKDVARAFVELQQYRHQADYDTQRSYTRSKVVGYVDAAQKLFDDWGMVRGQPAGKVFLATLFALRKLKS